MTISQNTSETVSKWGFGTLLPIYQRLDLPQKNARHSHQKLHPSKLQTTIVSMQESHNILKSTLTAYIDKSAAHLPKNRCKHSSPSVILKKSWVPYNILLQTKAWSNCQHRIFVYSTQVTCHRDICMMCAAIDQVIENKKLTEQDRAPNYEQNRQSQWAPLQIMRVLHICFFMHLHIF